MKNNIMFVAGVQDEEILKTKSKAEERKRRFSLFIKDLWKKAIQDIQGRKIQISRRSLFKWLH